MLPILGCRKQTGVPRSLYLCAEDYDSRSGIPTNAPALVVSQVQMVAGEPTLGKVTIKLSPPDAAVFEKLTTDNFGKTVVVVQGTNVLATPRITQPISAQAGIMIPISTNVDFGRAYQELLRLSSQ
jgi:hypothetical protein